MSVILTSFFKAKEFEGKKHSVARYQPGGYNYHELKFLFPFDKFDNPLKLSGYKSPLKEYKREYLERLFNSDKSIFGWLDALDQEENLILCCWCPQSTVAQSQLEKFGTFACHTGIIGQVINLFRPDITLILDSDRASSLTKQWKPQYYKKVSELEPEEKEK